MRYALVFVAMVWIAAAGCTENAVDQRKNARDRQDAALRDPFNYSPYGEADRDVSGGGLTDFESDSMRKDLNSVLNP